MATVVRSTTVIATVFFIFLITTALKGNAQQGSINLHKPVVVHATYIQLDSLLRLITKQTGARFSLNSRKFPAKRSIHISQHKQTIEELLQTIKRNTGVYYALLGDHIILLDNPPPVKKSDRVTATKKPKFVPARLQAPKTPPQSRQHPPKPNNAKPVSAINNNRLSVSIADTISKKTTTNPETPVTGNDITTTNSRTDKANIDSLKKPAVSFSIKDSAINKPTDKSGATAGNSNDTASQNDLAEEIASPKSELFIKPGFSADDVFYVNPTVHLGHTYLYGIAEWNTNFKIHGFRYGIGSSIPFQNWHLHFQFTTGSYSSTTADTISLNQEIKTKMHKAGIIAERRLSDRFSIQYGAVLNIMQLTFYRNGEKASPGFSEESIDKKFNLIGPVYAISDKNNSKLWLGVQVSFFYKLYFFKSK